MQVKKIISKKDEPQHGENSEAQRKFLSPWGEAR